MSVSGRNAVSLFLCLVGLSQGIGYLVGWNALQRAGLATGVSPLPVVFCDLHGYEPYTANTRMVFEDEQRRRFQFLVTPELCSHLTGPGFRRHMYMAVVALAPRLAKPIVQSVLCYGLRGPLMNELSMPLKTARISMFIQSRSSGNENQWTFDLSCSG